MKNLILTLSVLFLFILSCKKENVAPPSDQPPDYIVNDYTPKELIDYSIFKSGTYWIYKEASSNKTDSVYVYNYKGDSIEEFNIFYNEFHSYCYDTYNHDSVIIYIPFNRFDGGFMTKKYRPVDTIDYSLALIYPIVQNIIPVSTNGDQVNVSFKYFKLNVNSFSFDSVMYMDHLNMVARGNTNFPLGRQCKEYYVRHYGLVRFDLPDSNQIWNLIRCKLIQ